MGSPDAYDRTKNVLKSGELRAKGLTYERESRGVFAGINLSGAVVQPDDTGNEPMYGRAAAREEILSGGWRRATLGELRRTALLCASRPLNQHLHRAIWTTLSSTSSTSACPALVSALRLLTHCQPARLPTP